jgi:hypothetical protein
MTTADAHDAVELAEYIAIALGCSACPSTARHSARARVMSPVIGYHLSDHRRRRRRGRPLCRVRGRRPPPPPPGTYWAGRACRHRPRQYRTVFGHTSSARALSRTPTSSAACNIMRARRANCCEVEWARTSASNASRCAGSTITRIGGQ